MTLVVRYVGISEAMSVDGRQAITLTNFDPTHLTFDSFPISWPLALVAVFEGTEPDEHAAEAGRPFTGTASIFSPSGQSLVTLPAAGTTQARPFADLPPRFFFGMVAIVNFSEPGNYRLEMSLSVGGETVTADRPIYVRLKGAASS
jgi:hypothetical protein